MMGLQKFTYCPHLTFVTGTTAEVPRKIVAYILITGMFQLLLHGQHGKGKAGGAETALIGPFGGKKGGEFSGLLLFALYGTDTASLRPMGQIGTGKHRFAVYQYGAETAGTGVAAGFYLRISLSP